MISIRNISKTFGDNHVLKDVSIELEEGCVNFIIGRSGCGKSVMTKCMVGLLDIDFGEVHYHGRNFITMNEAGRKEIRKEIGMLFQGGALFDSMTVADNIKFPLKMFSDMSNSEMDDRVNLCLKRVELENKNLLYPAEISGGMKKRVGIARAIALNPKYLFCDEPNSGLDPQTAIVIDNLIHDLTYEYNSTTIVVSHDMNSVIEIGDRINFLNDGKLWWSGTKEEILRTDNQELNDFVFASEFMQQIRHNLRG
jgi:phospholipid/cholesterol/gamma-HCH transport system ATP-binding protein